MKSVKIWIGEFRREEKGSVSRFKLDSCWILELVFRKGFSEIIEDGR